MSRYTYDAKGLAAVQQARRKSMRLRELQAMLRGLFAGRRSLVLGSAPDAVGPDLARIEATVCINGSGWSARKMGIVRPQLTVISSRVTRPDHRVRAATMSILKGLETDYLLLIDVSEEMQAAKEKLDAAGIRYEKFTSVGPLERAAIVGEVCGAELGWGDTQERVSNGVFAVTLPIWAGASEVVLAGFSVEGGHSYIDAKTKRSHVAADTEFFSMAHRLSCKVTTTSHQLCNRFGIVLTA